MLTNSGINMPCIVITTLRACVCEVTRGGCPLKTCWRLGMRPLREVCWEGRVTTDSGRRPAGSSVEATRAHQQARGPSWSRGADLSALHPKTPLSSKDTVPWKQGCTQTLCPASRFWSDSTEGEPGFPSCALLWAKPFFFSPY